MNIWLKIGHIIYWMVWFGSVALDVASIGEGILIGLIAWIIWAVILQVMWWKKYREYLWE